VEIKTNIHAYVDSDIREHGLIHFGNKKRKEKINKKENKKKKKERKMNTF
jgi:hypothetical protein